MNRKNRQPLSEIINIRVTPGFAKELEDHCTANDISVSQLGRRVMKQYIAGLRQGNLPYTSGTVAA